MQLPPEGICLSFEVQHEKELSTHQAITSIVHTFRILQLLRPSLLEVLYGDDWNLTATDLSDLMQICKGELI
jgi:hypothetical protein